MKYLMTNLALILTSMNAYASAPDHATNPNSQTEKNAMLYRQMDKKTTAQDDPHSYYTESPLNTGNTHADSVSGSMAKNESASSSLGSFKSDLNRR